MNTTQHLGGSRPVYLPVLKATVIIDEYLVTCGACKSLLPEDFVTMTCNHSSCTQCLGDMEEYQCPKCMKREPATTHKDPIVNEIMKTYPRRVPCGTVCTGWMGASYHYETCISCANLKISQMSQNIRALRNTIKMLTSKLHDYDSDSDESM
jgi:hypothetical protein